MSPVPDWERLFSQKIYTVGKMIAMRTCFALFRYFPRSFFFVYPYQKYTIRSHRVAGPSVDIYLSSTELIVHDRSVPWLKCNCERDIASLVSYKLVERSIALACHDGTTNCSTAAAAVCCDAVTDLRAVQ